MMITRDNFLKMTAALALATTAIATPVMANAQSSSEKSQHRQKQKNQWRNLGYGAAALGAIGLLTKNNTLMWAGVGGAGYSAYRYEQDRKSQSATDRQRAQFFSRNSTWHNGHHYVRKTYWHNGTKYYKFVKSR